MASSLPADSQFTLFLARRSLHLWGTHADVVAFQNSPLWADLSRAPNAPYTFPRADTKHIILTFPHQDQANAALSDLQRFKSFVQTHYLLKGISVQPLSQAHDSVITHFCQLQAPRPPPIPSFRTSAGPPVEFPEFELPRLARPPTVQTFQHARSPSLPDPAAPGRPPPPVDPFRYRPLPQNGLFPSGGIHGLGLSFNAPPHPGQHPPPPIGFLQRPQHAEGARPFPPPPGPPPVPGVPLWEPARRSSVVMKAGSPPKPEYKILLPPPSKPASSQNLSAAAQPVSRPSDTIERPAPSGSGAAAVGVETVSRPSFSIDAPAASRPDPLSIAGTGIEPHASVSAAKPETKAQPFALPQDVKSGHKRAWSMGPGRLTLSPVMESSSIIESPPGDAVVDTREEPALEAPKTSAVALSEERLLSVQRVTPSSVPVPVVAAPSAFKSTPAPALNRPSAVHAPNGMGSKKEASSSSNTATSGSAAIPSTHDDLGSNKVAAIWTAVSAASTAVPVHNDNPVNEPQRSSGSIIPASQRIPTHAEQACLIKCTLDIWGKSVKVSKFMEKDQGHTLCAFASVKCIMEGSKSTHVCLTFPSYEDKLATLNLLRGRRGALETVYPAEGISVMPISNSEPLHRQRFITQFTKDPNWHLAAALQPTPPRASTSAAAAGVANESAAKPPGEPTPGAFGKGPAPAPRAAATTIFPTSAGAFARAMSNGSIDIPPVVHASAPMPSPVTAMSSDQTAAGVRFAGPTVLASQTADAVDTLQSSLARLDLSVQETVPLPATEGAAMPPVGSAPDVTLNEVHIPSATQAAPVPTSPPHPVLIPASTQPHRLDAAEATQPMVTLPRSALLEPLHISVHGRTSLGMASRESESASSVEIPRNSEARNTTANPGNFSTLWSRPQETMAEPAPSNELLKAPEIESASTGDTQVTDPSRDEASIASRTLHLWGPHDTIYSFQKKPDWTIFRTFFNVLYTDRMLKISHLFLTFRTIKAAEIAFNSLRNQGDKPGKNASRFEGISVQLMSTSGARARERFFVLHAERPSWDIKLVPSPNVPTSGPFASFGSWSSSAAESGKPASVQSGGVGAFSSLALPTTPFDVNGGVGGQATQSGLQSLSETKHKVEPVGMAATQDVKIPITAAGHDDRPSAAVSHDIKIVPSPNVPTSAPFGAFGAWTSSAAESGKAAAVQSGGVGASSGLALSTTPINLEGGIGGQVPTTGLQTLSETNHKVEPVGMTATQDVKLPITAAGNDVRPSAAVSQDRASGEFDRTVPDASIPSLASVLTTITETIARLSHPPTPSSQGASSDARASVAEHEESEREHAEAILQFARGQIDTWSKRATTAEGLIEDERKARKKLEADREALLTTLTILSGKAA